MTFHTGFYASLLIGLILDCIRSVCRLNDVNPLVLLTLSLGALVAYGASVFYLYKSRSKRDKD